MEVTSTLNKHRKYLLKALQAQLTLTNILRLDWLYDGLQNAKDYGLELVTFPSFPSPLISRSFQDVFIFMEI